MNLINFLGKNPQTEIYVVSVRNHKNNTLKIFAPESENTTIKRTPPLNLRSIWRVFNYLYFYSYCIYLLLKIQPGSVLYFETISAWPALFYKKLKGIKVKLFVHYHEYSSPDVYRKNMKLVRWQHQLETKFYSKQYEWISHTNISRLKMFKDDNNLNEINASVFHVMPNYPPRAWSIEPQKKGFSKGNFKKLVFVGSLGYENMYLQETVDWLGDHQEEFSLDIYSYNIDEKAKQFLENCNYPNVRLCKGIDYLKLPKILVNYDIGLDIYKPYAVNHMNGVSNKIFEYLACGLDVWFSIDKPLTLEFINEHCFPKLIPVDFIKLMNFDYRAAISRKELVHKSSEYFYETVYPEIEKSLYNRK